MTMMMMTATTMGKNNDEDNDIISHAPSRWSGWIPALYLILVLTLSMVSILAVMKMTMMTTTTSSIWVLELARKYVPLLI